MVCRDDFRWCRGYKECLKCDNCQHIYDKWVVSEDIAGQYLPASQYTQSTITTISTIPCWEEGRNISKDRELQLSQN